jgi:molybdopterin molybdotransferase
MINVEEAVRIIQKTVKDFGVEELPLEDALGRVLREDLHADRDFPPFNRVTMDGIAIRRESFAAGRRTFPIAGIAAAGAPPMTLRDPEACLEVMTGAILPAGTDAVIRYEDLEIANGAAAIVLDEVKPGQNIHRRGEDRPKGDRIVPRYRRLSPAELGVAATVGKAVIKVSRLPKTMIISTGDELVPVSETPLPHQIRRSNVHRLKATLQKVNVPVDTFHLQDDLEEILQQLKKILRKYEVVLLSGGVSKGKFDYLPEALAQLGVEKLFHRIAQRPGKPFWFGRAANGTTVFALPGNPISSFLCTHRYFLPWLDACLGLPPAPAPKAVLQEDVPFKPDLTRFLEVKLDFDDQGRILARPVPGSGSGDLANLVDADAFVELPRGKDLYRKGEVYPLLFYR